MDMNAHKPECSMFSCELKNQCHFPDNCDERGCITRKRDQTFAEQEQERNRRLRELNLQGDE